jgi:FkbM family methyltransferase
LKVKHIIKYALSGITIRIQSGPLKGKKWIATSGKKFITGKFEPYKTESFLKHFTKGSTFYDIGAHIGYFSAMASSINDGTGHVYSFEPRPDNARFFRKHMELNGFTNVTLREVAVSVLDGEALFNADTGTATGHLSIDGNIRVKVICIDKMYEEGILPKPDFIKIDVEGGEIQVLQGCDKVISTCKPTLLIATHGPETHAFVTSFLNNHHYRYEILNPGGSKGDTEIIALPKN